MTRIILFKKSMSESSLEKLKGEIIAILKKKEQDSEVKKAIEHFEQDEIHYTHLEKSLTGKWIEKAGYGVGTIRVWKGKKYKKVAPDKWVRMYDKEDRGAKSSMTRLINKVKACKTEEELYQFCMSNHALFKDANGVDLPIMDKLRAAIDEQKGKNESGKSEKNTADKKDVSKMSKDEILSEMAKQVKLKNNKDENYYEKLKNELDKINKISDQAKKDAGDKINVNDFTLNKLGKKIDGEYPKFNKEQQKKLFKRIIEEFGESEKARKLIQNMQDFNSQKGESLDINSYGDSWDYMKKQVGVGEPEKETYWITDSKRNRLTNEQAKKRIINSLNENDKLAAKLNSLDAADRIAVEKDIRMNQNDIDNLMGKLNPDDRKEMESEQKKHQNRSDAMKGNQNARKYGASMDDKEPIAKATKVADGKVTIPNDPAVKSQMKQLIASRYTDYVGNTSYGDMLSEVYYDGENLVSTDAKTMKVIKIGKLDGIEPNKYVKIDISGKDNISINQMDKKVGQYPNYKRVIPNGNDQTFAIDNKLAKEKIEAMKRDGSILKKDGKIALEFDGDAIKLDGTVIGKTYGTKLVGNDYIAIQADYILNVLGKNGEETNFNASENPQRALTVTTNVSTDVIMPMVAEKPDYEQNRKDFKEKQEFESERKAEAEKVKAEQDSRRIKAETKKELIGNRPDGIDADEYSSMIDFADDFYVKLGYDNSGERAYGMIKRMVDNAINQVNSKDYDFEKVLLNSDNRVSRKIFEMLTGERVGSNKQAAKRAWESWVGKEGVDAHNKKIADAEKAEKDRIAAEKKEKDDAEREKYHGFMDGKTPAGKGKAKDILEKKGNFSGKIMTYQELADKYIADGGYVSMQTYQTNSGKEKNYYYVMDKDGSGYEIPKTIYDYAKYIKDNSVKKSLADIIMLDEYEHEDFDDDFEDNDASQPELFNNPEENVANALNELFGC